MAQLTKAPMRRRSTRSKAGASVRPIMAATADSSSVVALCAILLRCKWHSQSCGPNVCRRCTAIGRTFVCSASISSTCAPLSRRSDCRTANIFDRNQNAQPTHVVYFGPDWNVNAEHGCVVGRSAHSLDSHLSGLRARYPSARAIAPTGAALSSTASVLASAASKRTSALIACCIIVPRVRRTRGTLIGRA